MVLGDTVLEELKEGPLREGRETHPTLDRPHRIKLEGLFTSIDIEEISLAIHRATRKHPFLIQLRSDLLLTGKQNNDVRFTGLHMAADIIRQHTFSTRPQRAMIGIAQNGVFFFGIGSTCLGDICSLDTC